MRANANGAVNNPCRVISRAAVASRKFPAGPRPVVRTRPVARATAERRENKARSWPRVRRRRTVRRHRQEKVGALRRPERKYVPEDAFGKTEGGLEHGVRRLFGAPTDRQRPEPQDLLPLEQVSAVPLVRDQFLARKELLLCFHGRHGSVVCASYLRERVRLLDVPYTCLLYTSPSPRDRG